MATPRKAIKEKRGPKTKFKDSMVKQAHKLMLLGVTEAVVADFFDVDVATLRRWKHVHPELRAVIEKGKITQDAEVANSLYNLANGTAIKATKVFYDADKAARAEARYWSEVHHYEEIMRDNEPGSEAYEDALSKMQALTPPSDEDGIVRARYVEHLPPSVGAQVFYLKNRQPDLWKDKREVTGNVGSEVKHIIEWAPAEGCDPLLTPEEIRAMEANDENERNGDTAN